jgi:hypothetical protein
MELQSNSNGDPDGRLTEAQLEALGKEVGLDPVNLRQALAEERTRIDAPAMERGVVASLYGSSGVTAQRTVRGTTAQVLKALDNWMQYEELLIPQRYFTERIVWEARTDFASRMKRATSGRGHALSRATTVGATVVAVDEGRALVRLDAHLGGYRSLMMSQNVGFTTAGVVGAAALAVIIPALIAAGPAVVIAGGSFAAARASHLKSVSRAQLALEQVLDRLERGEAGRGGSLLGALASAVVGRTR